MTRPDAIAQAKPYFERFIAEGQHGDMDWLAATAERRTDPQVLWPDARSVVMLGLNYGPDRDPLEILQQRARGAISVYAQGDDYHDLIKGKLKAIARWLAANAGGDVKVFVDTAAVMEKPLAASAGLGWQGKHTNLVSRQHGSWLFLGAIFTTLELAADAAEIDHCGSCQACLDICPTNAFPAPYRLDARRCISYLTIEHKGPIPRELRAADGQPHLRLRRLSRGVSVEQVRAGRPRGEAVGARGAARAEARRAGAARRCGVPRAVLQIAGEAHRARPLRAQRADRDRQLGRRRAGGGSRAPARRSLPAGARRRRVGAGAARSGALRAACRTRTARSERDAEVRREEWIAA